MRVKDNMIIIPEEMEGAFVVGDTFYTKEVNPLRPWEFLKFDGKKIVKVDFLFDERIHFKI